MDPLRDRLISLMWKVCRVARSPVKTNVGVILLNFTGIVFYVGSDLLLYLGSFRRRQL